MACKWTNGQYFLGQKYRGRNSQVQKTVHSWWKKKIARPISKKDVLVKHVYREHNQEADHRANMGAQGQRKIVLDKCDNSESWREATGMAASKTMDKVEVVW